MPVSLSSSDAPAPSRVAQLRTFLTRFGPLVAFLALFIFNALSADPRVQNTLNSAWTGMFDHPLFESVNETNTFLKPENLRNILRQNATVGIVALGMTLVIIAGGIDLSVGSMVALIGGSTILIINKAVACGSSEMSALAYGLGGGLLLGPLLGLINGLLITKGRIAPFIVTLGSMVAFRSLILTLANSGQISVQGAPSFSSLASWSVPLVGIKGSGDDWLPIPSPILVFFLLAALTHVLLFHTRYGRYVIAVGCNEKAALYSAINVDRVKWLTYAFVGFVSAVAAILLASRQNSVSSGATGAMLELDAIAAVVIGGTRMSGGSGSIVGTLLGVLILGIISNMLNQFGVPSELQGLVKGLVIIAAVLIQRKPAEG